MNLKFDVTTIFLWIIYASYQAAMILFLIFYIPESSLFEDGSTFSFWAGGHQVYGVCIILANLIVLKMENSFNGWNELIMICHIAFFYVSVFYYQEFMDESVVYGFWWEFIGSYTVWLGVFLCIFSIITID